MHSATRVARRWLNATTKRRYYHGTSAQHLSSIQSRGLLGAPPQRTWTGHLEAIPGYVYLTTSLWIASGYALDAAKSGEDLLILVVELDRDDPRVMAEEDILPKVYGKLIEQDLHVRPSGGRASRDVLEDLWDLAEGKPPRGTRSGSREHVEALMKATGGWKATLGAMIDLYSSPRAPDDRYGVLDDPAGYAGLIERLTRSLREKMETGLHEITMSRHVTPRRALDFATSTVPGILEGAAEESGGVRARTWMKYHEGWEREWPDWFGPEAGMVGGVKPTVAVKADAVKPDEIWLIPRKRNLRNLKSYSDLLDVGELVG